MSTIDTANAWILRLSREEDWIKEIYETQDTLRDGAPSSLLDRIFESDINKGINDADQQYSRMKYRNSLRAIYNLERDRNFYRENVDKGMNKGLAMRYIEAYLLVLSPIAPHWCEHMWSTIGRKGFIVNARWPEADKVDVILSSQGGYLRDLSHDINVQYNKLGKKVNKLKGMMIYVATEYEPLQKAVLEFLAKYITDDGFREEWKMDLLKNKDIITGTGKAAKKLKGQALSFANYVVNNEYKKRGDSCLEVATPFDEEAVLKESINIVTTSLIKLDPDAVSVHLKSAEAADPKKQKAKAQPGRPSFCFY